MPAAFAVKITMLHHVYNKPQHSVWMKLKKFPLDFCPLSIVNIAFFAHSIYPPISSNNLPLNYVRFKFTLQQIHLPAIPLFIQRKFIAKLQFLLIFHAAHGIPLWNLRKEILRLPQIEFKFGKQLDFIFIMSPS